MAILTNINKPAPKWFRILNRVWSPTENTIIAALLIAGYTDQAPLMLVVKLVSSYLRQLLDAVLVEDQNDVIDGVTSN
jgi:hypothetical protein